MKRMINLMTKAKRLAVMFLALTLYPFLLSGKVYASVDYATVLEQKIKLEKLMADNLKAVLISVIGTDNVTVVVTVVPDTEEIVSEEYTKKKIGEGARPQERKKEKKFLLPGVPVKTSLGTESERELVPAEEDVDTQTTYKKSVKLPESLIKQLSVQVFLDVKLDNKFSDIAKSITEDVLGIDYKRGDKVNINMIGFAPTPLPPELTRVEKIMQEINKFPPYLIWSAIGLVFFIFAFLLMRFIMRGLAKIFQASPSRETKINITGNPALAGQPAAVAAPGGGAAGAELSSGQPGTAAPREIERIIVRRKGDDESSESKEAKDKKKQEEEDLKAPFNFVSQENLSHLVYIVQKESIENICMIIAYLPPDFARQVLSSLPTDKRIEVTSSFAQSKEIYPEQLSKLNREIKSKIDFVLDGTERLSAILDQSDKTTRNEILEFLGRKDPELADRIRKSLFTFEDIVVLNNDDLQRVLREINLATLGEALRDLSNDLREKVYSKISEGASSMIRQEIELGRPMPQKKIEDAQRQIISVVKKLEKEGQIEIKKQEKKLEPDRAVPVSTQPQAASDEGRVGRTRRVRQDK